MGLHLWQRTPPKASDWIWIVDHVAQAGGRTKLSLQRLLGFAKLASEPA